MTPSQRKELAQELADEQRDVTEAQASTINAIVEERRRAERLALTPSVDA